MDFLSRKKDKETEDIDETSSLMEEVSQNIPASEIGKKESDKKKKTDTETLVAKGRKYNIPIREIEDESIPLEVLKLVPEDSAVHYNFAPLGIEEGVLEVGIVNPDNIEALDALNFISSKANMPFKVYLISEDDFEKVIGMYKGLTGEVNRALGELEAELAADDVMEVAVEQSLKDQSDVPSRKIKEDAPATKMVATILKYAVEGKASDVHIEHTGSKVRVRFRTDGELHTSLMLPATVHAAVTARIKILASLRLDERRKPQDGRFSATIQKRRIDFRVSTFPAYYGEKVVMRILDKGKGAMSLEELGIKTEFIDVIQEILKQPFGLILISGPTGSGKSTTLYSMLSLVDREKKNVVSLEDPIEYNIEGVSQSQVRPEIDYTFANGLRSVLRQDPDIIMVGEIRDSETAQLAVQAALTGHVVFSTIHTNTAVGAIPRLLDMGVDPYLIAPTLKMVMAQRLVRRLCPDSGRKIPVTGSLKIMIDKQFEDFPGEFRKEIPQGDVVYGVESTNDCPSGTRGRSGVYEIFTMSKSIEDMILKNPVEEEIQKIARSEGMLSMKEDAIIKSFNQIIPFEEVNTLGGELYLEDSKEEVEVKTAQ